MNLLNYKLDRNSSISLNIQLYRLIKNMIHSGILNPGEQCPTEQELMTTLDISRTVVQDAYNHLMDQNLVRRHRGKGTFVVENTIDLDFLQKIQPMAELIEKGGLTAKVKLIHKKVLPFNLETMGDLGLSPKDDVLEVTRIYEADDIPLAYFYFHYPLKRFPNIEQFDFEQSFLTHNLHLNYSYQFGSNYRTIYAVNLSDEVCSVLKVPKRLPGFKVHNISYDKDGLPSTTTTYYIRGNGININIDFAQNIIEKK